MFRRGISAQPVSNGYCGKIDTKNLRPGVYELDDYETPYVIFENPTAITFLLFASLLSNIVLVLLLLASIYRLVLIGDSPLRAVSHVAKTTLQGVQPCVRMFLHVLHMVYKRFVRLLR